MEQDQLPGMKPGRHRPGRVERGVDTDLRAARKRDTLPPDTGGLAAAARSTARHLDDCERLRKPGMVPQLLAQLRETYRDLGLTGGTDGQDSDAWLGAFGASETPHSP